MFELKREACFIGGAWLTNGKWVDVDDPASGSVIGRVPDMGRAEAEHAIAAAHEAMGVWAATTARARADILVRFHDLVLAHRSGLAELLVAEQGKPLGEALGEIDYAASFLRWFAEEGRRSYGEIVPAHMEDKRILVLRQPVGVVGAITPWNFPAAMVTRKIAPALAAGCGVVLKPAPQTPFTALALAKLGEEAGLPSGLLNVVTGDAAEIGGALTAHRLVRKISFTGSTPIGALLYQQSATTIKKLSLELGGNAPFIVFDDADVDAAVTGAILSKFRNAGQTCVCANRIYVQSGIYEAFVERLSLAVDQLRVGAGSEAGVAIGPLIDAQALDKVEAHIADALAKGAGLVSGGSRHPLGGRFFTPTILRDVTSTMRITREETFGPVAPLIRFSNEAEVIALANETDSGLAAYLYAGDMSRIWRVAEAIEAGMVGVNTGLISTEVAPFGGVKMSGLGREGSRHGLEDYQELKYICLSLDAPGEQQ
ncbi:NAD-dependent succinate-semialdehyde dehydrogenase [Sphingobium sp. WCS2017Hpa-17]|uniref:NAD-dependent succinate-semialdehyde dehydrogenase n=1 Tax=Sphingobium sp. WCS2017Hpa-17 TaxID=3073638 RepID=UPI00288C39E6|nr:NAD-dependent succinate-semialdehyde dehydrogenase [Sphingobium sp. WCS2017Hpa-17]